MARILLLTALVASVSFAGCIYNPVALVPSLAPLDSRQPMVRYKPIQGSACEHYVFYVIATNTDPMREALYEMKRLDGVDGYVEVTIEARVYPWLFGYTKCVTATGYPVTYGTQPRQLRLRGGRSGGLPDLSVRTVAPPPRVPPRPGSPQPTISPAARAGASAPGPVVAPSPRPSPGVGRPTGARPSSPSPLQCTAACDHFGKLAGSTPIIQQVVMEKCAQRCGAGDWPYYNCAKAAASPGAVKRCNALPRAGR